MKTQQSSIMKRCLTRRLQNVAFFCLTAACWQEAPMAVLMNVVSCFNWKSSPVETS